jgi:hypothetical protein
VAFVAGAFVAGAFLAGAFLAGAFLAGAFVAGAFVAGAFVAGALLVGALLVRAFLAGAFLAGAFLAGAFLAGAVRGAAIFFAGTLAADAFLAADPEARGGVPTALIGALVASGVAFFAVGLVVGLPRRVAPRLAAAPGSPREVVPTRPEGVPEVEDTAFLMRLAALRWLPRPAFSASLVTIV